MSGTADKVRLVEREGGIEFQVKAVPGASRDRIAGVWNTALRVAVSAAPEGGRANKQIIRLLSDVFGVRPAAVAITHGLTRPIKRVRIAGISIEQARAALSAV
jgi:uncharacterized protein (TIGR00251 family)